MKRRSVRVREDPDGQKRGPPGEAAREPSTPLARGPCPGKERGVRQPDEGQAEGGLLGEEGGGEEHEVQRPPRPRGPLAIPRERPPGPQREDGEERVVPAWNPRHRGRHCRVERARETAGERNATAEPERPEERMHERRRSA